MSYKRSKYFITSSNIKIKYLLTEKNSEIAVVFFHGFMSDMTGEKPKAIQKFCNKNNLNFLRFEYSGHGKSTGEFVKGNISKWTNEAKDLINLKVSPFLWLIQRLDVGLLHNMKIFKNHIILHISV